MQVKSLGQEDSLEQEIATSSNILAWEILWTEESGGLQFIESQRVRHKQLSTHMYVCVYIWFLLPFLALSS